MWSTEERTSNAASSTVRILEEAKSHLVLKLRFGIGVALLIALVLQGTGAQILLAAAALLIYLQAQRIFLTPSTVVARINWARLDVVVYSGIVAATGGLYSPLLVFTLFPVAFVGFREGARGTLAAVVLTSVIGGLVPWLLLPESAVGPEWPWTIVFLPSIVLTVVLWGRAEIAALRGLASLHDLQSKLLTGEGADDWVAELSQSLRLACNADACLVMVSEPHSERWTLAFANRKWPRPLGGDHGTTELPAPFQALLQSGDTLFASEPRSAWSPPVFEIIPVPGLDGDPDPRTLVELDACFGRKPLASFPLLCGRKTLGRVFIVSPEGISAEAVRGHFRLASQMTYMLELLWKKDASAVQAHRARRKISRDLHDGAVQPIIGLKLALEALKRKAGSALSMELDDLIRMTGEGIQDLRRYVSTLNSDKRPDAPATRPDLLEALKQQASRFSHYHGIRTSVLADADIEVDPALHEEISYIVKEGLSNIRRHSQASSATISLKSSRNGLILKLINDDGTNRLQDTHFFPRSIAERATDLGGSVRVHRNGSGLTSVEVKLPLANNRP